MNPKLKALRLAIQQFAPSCEQEERDQAVMIRFLEQNDNCLDRASLIAHFTASSWIVNPDRDKVLMIYHNIYDSWSWTGGHADGEPDLLSVALREAREETGVRVLRPLRTDPISLEIITVDGHEKRGSYVPSHLHLNLTFLLEAEEDQPLTVKADENSGVRWIPVKELADYVSEPWMLKRIYAKLSAIGNAEVSAEVCRKVRLTGLS